MNEDNTTPPGDHMVVIKLTFVEVTVRPLYQIRAFGTKDECLVMAANVPDVVYNGDFTVEKAEVMVMPREQLEDEDVEFDRSLQ